MTKRAIKKKFRKFAGFVVCVAAVLAMRPLWSDANAGKIPDNAGEKDLYGVQQRLYLAEVDVSGHKAGLDGTFGIAEVYSENVSRKTDITVRIRVDDELYRDYELGKISFTHHNDALKIWNTESGDVSRIISNVTHEKKDGESFLVYRTQFSPIGSSGMYSLGIDVSASSGGKEETGTQIAGRLIGNVSVNVSEVRPVRIIPSVTVRVAGTLYAEDISGPEVSASADSESVCSTVFPRGWKNYFNDQGLDASYPARCGDLYTFVVQFIPGDGFVADASTQINIIGEACIVSRIVSEDGKFLWLEIGVVAQKGTLNGNWQSDKSEYHYRNCGIYGQNGGSWEKKPHEWGQWQASDWDPENEKRYCAVCGADEFRYAQPEKIWFLEMSVRQPEAGKTPSSRYLSVDGGYSDFAEIVPDSVKWFGENDSSPAKVFVRGQLYTVEFTLRAKGGRVFDTDNLSIDYLDRYTSGAVTRKFSDDLKELTVRAKIRFPAADYSTVDVSLPSLTVGQPLPLPSLTEGEELLYAGVECIVQSQSGVYKTYFFHPVEKRWYVYGNLTGLTSPATEEDLLVVAGETYKYGLAVKAEYGEKVFINVVNTGNAQSTDIMDDLVCSVYRMESDYSKIIPGADITVNGFGYGNNPDSVEFKVPADAKFTLSNLRWSPSGQSFGEGKYTVTFSLEASEGYTFADKCIVTVNGHKAEYDSLYNTVSYTFPSLEAPHVHEWSEWNFKDEESHYRTCSCGTVQTGLHDYTDWQRDNKEKDYYRECFGCLKVVRTDSIPSSGNPSAAVVVVATAAVIGVVTAVAVVLTAKKRKSTNKRV